MRKSTLLLSVAMLLISSVYAQNQHESKLRYIRYRALLLVDEYARNCALRDNYEVDYFNNVFEPGAMINNDVLPANALNDSVSIEEYSNLLYQYHIDPIYAEVRAYSAFVEEGEIQDGGRDVGVVYVDAFKHIESTSKNGYSYNDTLDIRFTIAYDITDTVFVISKVETNQRYGKYVVIGVTNKKEGKNKVYNSDLQTVLLKGDTIQLSSKGEVFRKNVDGNQTIHIEPVSDAYFQTKQVDIVYDRIGADDENRSNFRSAYFRKKRFYIRPSASLFMDNKDFGMVGDVDYPATKSSFGISFGLDLGINLITFKSIPLSVSLLVGGKYSFVDYTLTADEHIETYNAVDPDGINYTRTSQVNALAEEGSFSFIHIPLSLRFDYQLNKQWSVYAGLGYSYALERNLNYSSTAHGDYAGTYGPEYFNIVLNENGVYDFGQFDLAANEKVKGTENMGLLKFDIGASYRFNKRLYGEFGFGYWNGLDALFMNVEHLSGSYEELNTTYQKTRSNNLNVLNFEIGLKYYL